MPPVVPVPAAVVVMVVATLSCKRRMMLARPMGLPGRASHHDNQRGNGGPMPRVNWFVRRPFYAHTGRIGTETCDLMISFLSMLDRH
jgi:hypothetical protein